MAGSWPVAVTADRTVAELARDVEFFDADVAIATGQRTGNAASMEELRALFGDFLERAGVAAINIDDAETAAVADEVIQRQVLAGDHQDVVVDPGLVDRREARIIECADIDAADFDPDLRSHLAYLDHGGVPFSLLTIPVG